MAARGSRTSRVLLVLALLLTLVVVAGAGAAVVRARWRRSHPRVLQVSLGGWPQNYSGIVHPLLDSEVSFVGSERLIVAEKFSDNRGHRYHGQVWSIETGKLERTFDSIPRHESGSIAAFGYSGQSPTLVNLATGALTPLAFDADFRCSLSLAGDLVAVLDSTRTTVEVRATRDGALVRALRLPEVPKADPPSSLETFGPSPMAIFGPSLRLAAAGDRLAVRQWGKGEVEACDLATGAWRLMGAGSVVGFAPDGVVLDVPTPHHLHAVVLARSGGEPRVLVPETAEPSLHALSASGERFASLEWPTGSRCEVVVQEVLTGDVVRRIPVLEGGVESLALSPEGERLAIAFLDGRVEVWELP